MATYSIQAPNGKTYQIDGPDGASDDQIRAQVLQQHPDAAGVSPAPEQAAPSAGLSDPGTVVGGRYPNPDETDAYKNFTQAGYVTDANGKILGPPGTKIPTPTRQELATKAGQALSDAGDGTDLGKGLLGGLRAFPGANYLTAGLEYALPSAITGNNSDASFDDILKTVQARTAADQGKSLAGNIGGQVLGAIGGGGLLGKGIGALAEAGAPAANVLQKLVTLEKGAPIANAAKLSATGALSGAAAAVNAGDDPVTGAEFGAVAPVGLGLVSKFLVQPAADILRIPKAVDYIKRFTNSTTEELNQLLAQYRARTGAEPTMFELLPKADQDSLAKNAISGRAPVVEQVSNAVQDRAANVALEMRNVVHGATNQDVIATQRQMHRNLAEANGGTTVPGDDALAVRASRSPTDMLALRREETRRIMAPHDMSNVVGSFQDIIPHHPQLVNGSIVNIESDPEISRAIRSVAEGIPRRPEDAGINVREISDMISSLRDNAASSSSAIERGAANQAANHLMDVLDQNVPEAAAATQRMRDAYAANSRMAEGLGEGWQSRLRDEIQTGTSNQKARGVQNAYDTDEGVAGRQLGQTNKLMSDLSGTPQAALASTIDIGRGGSKALADNLGQNAADRITSAAREQTKSIEGLNTALGKAKNDEGNVLSGADVAGAVMSLSPHTFITTKAHGLKMFASGNFMSDSRARAVADMLFSQDPRLTQRAIDALGQTAKGRALYAGIGGLLAQNASAQKPGPAAPAANLPPIPEISSGVEPAGNTSTTPPASPVGQDPNVPYGRQVIQSIFPDAKITEDVRDPNSPLGKETPNSYHEKSQNAVDVRPIKGMTFKEFIQQIHDQGHTIVEAIDEVNHPSKHATGPHWHVVIAG